MHFIARLEPDFRYQETRFFMFAAHYRMPPDWANLRAHRVRGPPLTRLKRLRFLELDSARAVPTSHRCDYDP